MSQLRTSYSCTEQIRRYREEIIRCVNRVELVPELIEEDLIEDQELLNDDEWRLFLDSLIERGKTDGLKFLQCVQRAKEHMGHSYICTLLEGKPLAEADRIQASNDIKKGIRKNMTQLVNGINLFDLVPVMQAKGLLTNDEREVILPDPSTHAQTRRQRVIHLVQKILVTKGPLGYTVFAECLKEEEHHSAHFELYQRITGIRKRKHEELELDDESDTASQSVVFVSKRTPISLEMQEPLGGDHYIDVVSRFQNYNQNGNWEQLRIDAEHYKKSGVVELHVTALQEEAMSCIFRKKWESALSLVCDAASKCQEISTAVNSKYLLARCENIKSTLYRYRKEYDKAKDHVKEAKAHLIYLKHGEDHAMNAYIEACIGAECQDKPKDEIIKQFDFALQIFRSSTNNTVRLLRSHAPIRMAEVHIGATQFSPGTTNDPESICAARNCLEAVNLKDLPVRYQSHFYIAKSDLHRCTSKSDLHRCTSRSEEKEEARWCAEKALKIALKNDFVNEIRSAEARLKLL